MAFCKSSTLVLLPGEFHEQAGYSPWCRKELDMTEATEHTLTEGEKRPVSPLEDSREKSSFLTQTFWLVQVFSWLDEAHGH